MARRVASRIAGKDPFAGSYLAEFPSHLTLDGLNTRVTAANYREDTRSWDITLADGGHVTSRFLITAIGILEYFQGGSHATTEQRLMLHEPVEAVTAQHLAARLGEMTSHSGHLIVNTYRDHASIRILELFGKRFDFRDRKHVHDLLAPLNFRSFHLAGSGHIYDVEVFEKSVLGG